MKDEIAAYGGGEVYCAGFAERMMRQHEQGVLGPMLFIYLVEDHANMRRPVESSCWLAVYRRNDAFYAATFLIS